MDAALPATGPTDSLLLHHLPLASLSPSAQCNSSMSKNSQPKFTSNSTYNNNNSDCTIKNSNDVKKIAKLKPSPISINSKNKLGPNILSTPNARIVDGRTTVNLITLAASTLAASIAAAEPIRRLAMESNPVFNHHHTTHINLPDHDKLVHHCTNESVDSFDPLNLPLCSSSSLLTTETFSSSSGIANARLKVDGTVVTDADGEAQRVIIEAIRRIAPTIRIVGEESKADQSKLTHATSPTSQSRYTDIFEFCRMELMDREQQIVRCAPKKRRFLAEQREMSKILNDDVLSDGVASSPSTKRDACGMPVRKSSSSESMMTSEDMHGKAIEVDASRVSVFVDPLDGSKNYSMGKYDNVTTLIAIVVDNEPCFGVICKPFGQRHTEKTPQHNRNSSLSTSLEAAHITNRPYQQDDKQNESLKCYDSSKILNGCFAIYGGTLLGNCYVTGGDKIIRPKKNPTIPRAVISKSRSVGIVRQTIDVLHSQDMLSDNPIYVSGAGEKALRLLIGTEEEALWAFPRPGTSLWDVAAADAMLLACGGMLTDGKGKRIDYLLRGNGCDNKDATGGNQNGESNIIKLLGEKKSKESNLISYNNEEGIVAAISLELHEAAIRVIHDLEGHVNQNSVEDDGVGIK